MGSFESICMLTRLPIFRDEAVVGVFLHTAEADNDCEPIRWEPTSFPLYGKYDGFGRVLLDPMSEGVESFMLSLASTWHTESLALLDLPPPTTLQEYVFFAERSWSCAHQASLSVMAGEQESKITLGLMHRYAFDMMSEQKVRWENFIHQWNRTSLLAQKVRDTEEMEPACTEQLGKLASLEHWMGRLGLTWAPSGDGVQVRTAVLYMHLNLLKTSMSHLLDNWEEDDG